MKTLLQTNHYEKAGQVLESDGKFEQAIAMYMKSNRLARIPKVLLNHADLLSDHNLVTSILKNLLKHDLFEGAAEIYEKLDKADLALQCYRKGKCFKGNAKI